MKWSLLLVPISALLTFTSCRVPETYLLRHLLNDTSPSVRPVYNPEKAVVVTFGFTLVQIVNLNEAEQVIMVE